MWRDERGMALVLVLLCTMLLLALGGALVTVISSEAHIAATFRDGAIALGGAEAAIVRVLPDVAAAQNLDALLNGAVVSSFVDGPPGPRRLPDGTILDVVTATNIERCGEAVCADEQLDAVTAERPWGANNPRWQLYACGWLRDLTPQAVAPPHVYAIVWIGDDPLESDGDPTADARDVDATGHNVVLLRAAAYAGYSVRRRIEVAARREGGVVRLTSWREIR